MKEKGFDTLSVGKIYDIFAGCGISDMVRTTGNADGMSKTDMFAKTDFRGLCFTNLVDFDMLYGHRRDSEGYTQALNEFDSWLSGFIKTMNDDDILMITADHGCDPGFKGTDHTREYIPFLMYGNKVAPHDLGVRKSFADIASTIADIFDVDYKTKGCSFANQTIK